MAPIAVRCFLMAVEDVFSGLLWPFVSALDKARALAPIARSGHF